MSKFSSLYRIVNFSVFVVVVLTGCARDGTETDNVQVSTVPASASVLTPLSSVNVNIPPNATWQIQYTGEMDYSLDVEVFNLDLFDSDTSAIAQLHDLGVFVMCYFSKGSYENWRPDADKFLSDVLGRPMAGWEGESWLDVRRIDLLEPILNARLDLAVQKGCDGVDPDNVNGYENETGFPLTPEDQIAYNKFLSMQVHARGLSIGLKNDLDQIPELVSFFDWVINEERFSFGECQLLQPFIDAGKPVFVIEYELSPDEFCNSAGEMGFSALYKNWELDAYRFSCN